MTLTSSVIKRMIKKIISGEDYRIEIVSLIDAEFLQYTIEFFKKVVEAKLKNQPVTTDWYKDELLSSKLPSEEIIINSGLNRKTISNMYNSTGREIILEASINHYESLYNSISSLVESGNGVDIKLTIKFNDVSIDLNINESLIVINTLAVKRSALRGGLWGSAGKQVEKPIVEVLCKLYEVPEQHYEQSRIADSVKDGSFYLIGNSTSDKYRCELKLAGKSDIENVDTLISKETKVLLADKLSDTNKEQLNVKNVEWIELKGNGYQKFEEILNKLSIPHGNPGDIESSLHNVLERYELK